MGPTFELELTRVCLRPPPGSAAADIAPAALADARFYLALDPGFETRNGLMLREVVGTSSIGAHVTEKPPGTLDLRHPGCWIWGISGGTAERTITMGWLKSLAWRAPVVFSFQLARYTRRGEAYP